LSSMLSRLVVRPEIPLDNFYRVRKDECAKSMSHINFLGCKCSEVNEWVT
jgi:hypothetical protein